MLRCDVVSPSNRSTQTNASLMFNLWITSPSWWSDILLFHAYCKSVCSPPPAPTTDDWVVGGKGGDMCLALQVSFSIMYLLIPNTSTHLNIWVIQRDITKAVITRNQNIWLVGEDQLQDLCRHVLNAVKKVAVWLRLDGLGQGKNACVKTSQLHL